MATSKRELVATPTEYKGVVYRSKCEAMFARWIEIEMIGFLGYDHFHYEPKYLEIDRWVPDFCVLKFSKEHCLGRSEYPSFLPRVEFDVIEYKPSKPTKAYVDQFIRRCKKLQESLVSQYGPSIAHVLDFSLHYGSLWSENSNVIRVLQLSDDEWLPDDDGWDWLSFHADAIRNTRFDLEATHAS